MKIEINNVDKSEWITDDIGGKHSEGIGWNPNGEWCGECSNVDCSTCGVWKRKVNGNE